MSYQRYFKSYLLQEKLVREILIPWQVWFSGGCGGTILDSCTILTAAHCDITTNDMIRAGSLNKNIGGQVIYKIS